MAIIIYFRVPIKDLIDRMQHFKGFGVDATFFERQAQNLADESKLLVTLSPEITTQRSEEPRRIPIEGAREATVSSEEALWGNSLRGLARTTPRAVVTEAWTHVEGEIAKLAKPYGVRKSIVTTLRGLVQLEVIPGRVANVIQELRTLRNDVAHNPDFEVVEDAALDYLDACINTVVVLESLP